MKVTNSTPAKLFTDYWAQIRNALTDLALFTTTHLTKKHEDEFVELDGQLDAANLMARSTICMAKVAEFLWCSRVRAAVEAPRDSREGDRAGCQSPPQCRSGVDNDSDTLIRGLQRESGTWPHGHECRGHDPKQKESDMSVRFAQRARKTLGTLFKTVYRVTREKRSSGICCDKFG